MAVFSSSLPRTRLQVENNLYDIVNNIPQASVIPLSCSKEKSDCIEFEHKTNSFFESKKKSKLKVRTVRDIRKEYENYVYTYLKDDLEKQNILIFKKIQSGSAGEDDTVNIAMKILQSDQPKLRSTWFMIMKVNPLRKRHSIQYAFWNGIKIRLSGSKGGSDKFKWKYDISQTRCLKRTSKYKHLKQKDLLKSSIASKFEPGPLSKKYILDKSYQKQTIGEATLVELPRASLVIESKYNSALHSSVLKYIEDAPDENGKLSENWTNFALSALGTSVNGSIIQKPRNFSFKFQLKYKNGQRLLLTRNDVQTVRQDYKTEFITKQTELQETHEKEISAVVEELVRATEINIIQDQLFVENKEEPYKSSENSKLNENLRTLAFPICQNEFCSMGCVCDALKYKYTKNHCGLPGCIFQCTCTAENNRNSHVKYEDMLGLVKFESNVELNYLKKQEKTHNLDENNLKKSQRRKRKASKAGSSFCSELSSQCYSTIKEVSVKVLKLNCDNIECWCMVHNLYNCFCKGTIVESVLSEENSSLINTNENTNAFSSNSIFVNDKIDAVIAHYEDNLPKINLSAPKLKNKTKCGNDEKSLIQIFSHKSIDEEEDNSHLETSIDVSNVGNEINSERDETCSIPSLDQTATSKENNQSLKRTLRASRFQNMSKDENDETNLMKCARIRPFKRRYKDVYYFSKNKKILEMEMNDINLQKKLHAYFVRSLTPDLTDTEQNPEKNSCSFPKITESPSDLGNLTEQPHKLIKNKAALVSWLEANYKRHKEKLESGSKIILEPPRPGKLALYPWEVLLERYREKKNFFLISRKPNHRIFIAVDCNNKFFNDCINIDEIRYSDLNKYPETVKNLLTNTVNAKDTFYLLFGLSFCWELYGNVVKSKDTNKIQTFEVNSKNDNLLIQTNSKEKKQIEPKNINVSSSNEKHDNDICLVLPNSNDSDCMSDSSQKPFDYYKSKETDTLIMDNSHAKPISRWFFMTIEDDFDELQFVEKGFFVKYENIIKAIEVARSMKKTVRLSGLKCKGDNNNPQFGIYALCDMEKLCVFVGPYDENEKLGMETLKGQRTYASSRKTRGSWLITKKIDNYKVIEDPMFFLPRKKEMREREVVKKNLEDSSKINNVDKKIIDNKTIKSLTPTPQDKISPEKPLKLVKPITIRKSNELFHIKNNPISLLRNPKSVTPKIIVNKNAMTPKIYVNKNQLIKPVFATVTKKTISNRSLLLPNSERGMLILKPEEINKKLAASQLLMRNVHPSANRSKNNKNVNVESFRKENRISKKFDSHSDDILIISDDEDTCVNFVPENWKDVWIAINNIPNFGCFRGKKNEKDELSFQFPGFNFSEFYKEKEAFQVLNKLLCRMVYLPKSLHLEWRVFDSVEGLECNKYLRKEDFAPGLIMTKEGMVTKSEMRSKIQQFLKNSFADLRVAVFCVTNKEIDTVHELINEAEIVINKLEATSKKLEKERNSLQEEVLTKKKRIMEISTFLPERMQNLIRNNLELMDF